MKTHDRTLARLLAGVALGAVLAGAAIASPGAPDGHGPAKMFERMDADGSGGVTLEEMRAGALARFAQADADKDGKVSRAEFDAAAQMMREARGGHGHDGKGRGHGPDGKRAGDGGRDHGRMAARIMGRADADESGGLSPAEYLALSEMMQVRRPGVTPPEFAALDANADGQVDEAELGAGLAVVMANRPDRPRGDGADRGERFFGMLDQNGDGWVTVEELDASPMMDRMGAMFARLDVDGDGAVTLAEAQAMRGHGGRDQGPGMRHGAPPTEGAAPKLDAKP